MKSPKLLLTLAALALLAAPTVVAAGTSVESEVLDEDSQLACGLVIDYRICERIYAACNEVSTSFICGLVR